MGQFVQHAFVCTHGKTCPRQGSLEVFEQLRHWFHAAGLTDRVRINKAGCLAQCGHGPLVVVYPTDCWYAGVRAEDAAELAASIQAGRTLDRLRYCPDGPGPRICPPGQERIPPRSDGS